jgi:hypothetical protein
MEGRSERRKITAHSIYSKRGSSVLSSVGTREQLIACLLLVGGLLVAHENIFYTLEYRIVLLASYV